MSGDQDTNHGHESCWQEPVCSHLGSPNLPYDVLLRILRYLPPRDVFLGLYSTNKYLHRVLGEEKLWRAQVLGRYPKDAYPILPDEDSEDGSLWRKRDFYHQLQRHNFPSIGSQMNNTVFSVVEEGHRINALTFVNNGLSFVAGGNDHRVTLWNLREIRKNHPANPEDDILERARTVLQKHADWVTSLRCCEGKMISSGSMDRSVRVFDANHAALMLTMRASRGVLCHSHDEVAISRIVAGMHGTIEVFDGLVSPEPVMRKALSETEERLGLIWDIAVSGYNAVILSNDRTIRLLDLRNRKFMCIHQLDEGEHGMRMDVKGNYCWVGTNTGKVRLFKSDNLELVQGFSEAFGFSESHRVVGLHYDAAHILACSADGALKIVEASKRPRLIWQWQSHFGRDLRTMDYSKDCSLIASCADRVSLWWPKESY